MGSKSDNGSVVHCILLFNMAQLKNDRKRGPTFTHKLYNGSKAGEMRYKVVATRDFN